MRIAGNLGGKGMDDSETPTGGDESGAPAREKFGRYLQRLETKPFLKLLATRTIVNEHAAMRVYGFTPQTRSWPSKLSFIASKARRELREQGIVLGRASNRRGWSLPQSDRMKLSKIIQQE